MDASDLRELLHLSVENPVIINIFKGQQHLTCSIGVISEGCKRSWKGHERSWRGHEEVIANTFYSMCVYQLGL